MVNPEHATQWINAFEAKFDQGKLWGQEEWGRILGDYSAVTDIPPAAFPEELIKAYPSAKVILTIRDEDTWFNSVNNTIWKGWKMDQTPPGPLRSMLEALHKYLWRDDFETYGREYFRRQNDLVRKLMADRPGDFLEYNINQGWGPLCQFLGKEVPQEEFPRKDAWAQFKKDQEDKSAVDGVAAPSDVHA
ncbi:hypothetical protein Plec18167_000177 [Paecilomyces lecythidis]|uniref:Uncharacterized protein n=1 Tax=Paecilomyces lecythidis TaxID=3004212 RepID=A0ABR3YDN6_9EURO